ncbi:Z1 domain-containing protein [Chitinophaga niabensis]|uniref:Z1 domain-containing protein n=1 Tax=Chitinophaga niabensis TaxID=536979 RepID=UPI0031BB3864
MSEDIRKVNNWHEEAMDFAEMAFFANRRNEQKSYWKFIQHALNYEKAAAKFLKDENAVLSRSILYQGAVHFALNLNDFAEAQKLIEEALQGQLVEEIKVQLEKEQLQMKDRVEIKEAVVGGAMPYLVNEDEIKPERVVRALNAGIKGAEVFYGKENLDALLNRLALQATLESKHIVSNPEHQIFENQKPEHEWVKERKGQIVWNFWNAYKKYLDEKGLAATTITKLDHLTDDILNRIGDPLKPGIWDKRGMIVGDVQSGKTSNYIGLINKAADAGFRIIIILSGLYENLRQQTQYRVDEGFSGASSVPGEQSVIGVGKHRSSIPVHPITGVGDNGDLKTSSMKNLPLDTKDYYALVIKKNPTVLRTLLAWLYAQGKEDGNYRIIRNIPLLIIDDEADYASINVDKEFVSKINGYIRSTLGLFEQSAFVGYTATPFANIFISDRNKTEDKDLIIDGKRFRLGKDLFPKDFIINIPPPSNYIGYTKVFNTDRENGADEDVLPMMDIVDDFELYIPKKHLKEDTKPEAIPPSLENAVNCFIIVCAIRIARGQAREHNSMLVHVSWYIDWINHIAGLVNDYLQAKKNILRYNPDGKFTETLMQVWTDEFKGRTEKIAERLGYEDPRMMEHDWEEIAPFLSQAIEKIDVRAVHGPKKGMPYDNVMPLNYNDYQKEGLSVIAVGGNKLSRGLTLEGLSVSYFLRATRFYDTLLQMGRWFGYRQGYADLCRVFTTWELITWYQYIGNATEELKEQFDIMDLAERNPGNFGLKVRSAPGTLMISAAAKIKGATELRLSYSGQLLETYILSKSPEILHKNLDALVKLAQVLGPVSGKVRQSQPYIWENVSYSSIDVFLENYDTGQQNIRTDFIRRYITLQLKNGNLINWTVVLINNSNDDTPFGLQVDSKKIAVGRTERKESIKKKGSQVTVDPSNYIIRQSRIISPPHEYIDMEETDERYIKAWDDTIRNSKSKGGPKFPAGKYIREYRGPQNALLLIYLLDPVGFGGRNDLPATGYAISLPQIENDKMIPYMANDVYLQELNNAPDAEEDPENENEN